MCGCGIPFRVLQEPHQDLVVARRSNRLNREERSTQISAKYPLMLTQIICNSVPVSSSGWIRESASEFPIGLGHTSWLIDGMGWLHFNTGEISEGPIPAACSYFASVHIRLTAKGDYFVVNVTLP